MDLLSNLSSFIAAVASLITAWIALGAWGAWRKQEKYKKEVELCMLVFELLSDIEVTAKIYARELIRLTAASGDEKNYLDNVNSYSEKLGEYARVYARIEILSFTHILEKLPAADKLNTAICDSVDQRSVNGKADVTPETKRAHDKIEGVFKETFASLKTVIPTAK